MDNKFVLEGVTLSTLRDWLNENKMKTPVSQEGSSVVKEFTIHSLHVPENSRFRMLLTCRKKSHH